MNLLKDSYFGTTCLLFEPRVIAASAVYLSSMILDCVPPARTAIAEEPTQLVSASRNACGIVGARQSYRDRYPRDVTPQPVSTSTSGVCFSGVVRESAEAVRGTPRPTAAPPHCVAAFSWQHGVHGA